VEVDLLDDLRVVVAELRSHDRERIAARGARRRRDEKFDARLRGGAAAASSAGCRGSMLWIESASRISDPVTGLEVITG
jgi:hypothetical protein